MRVRVKRSERYVKGSGKKLKEEWMKNEVGAKGGRQRASVAVKLT